TPVELTEDQQNLLAQVTSAVEQIARAHPGVWIEHKPASAVVHTRALAAHRAPDVLQEAMAGPGTLPAGSPIQGNPVVELAVAEHRVAGVEEVGQLLSRLAMWRAAQPSR